MADAVFFDTNVLLSALTPSRRLHEAAIRALDDAGMGCVSNQVLRELLVVSTRPIEANGLGLDGATAVRNAEVFVQRMRLLPDDADVAARLRDFVRQRRSLGRQIHDANIAATMLAHGVSTLVTGNAGDFQRFADVITVRDLAQI